MKTFFALINKEKNMGSAVRYLVFIAAAICGVGGVLYLYANGYKIPDYQVFQNGPPGMNSIADVLSKAASFDSDGIIMLGVLFLIFIPVVRVAMFLVSFILKKNYLYCIISTIVLIILIYSFFNGRV
jgi:uncharacterized membrane protein